MNKFLEISHKALTCIRKYDRVHIVLGNETCDLDSAISSLVYAFYLHTNIVSAPDTKTVVIPVLNITKEEFPLKTEAKYFLTKNNISFTNLTFRNHVDLNGLNKCNKLALTLVDHHILPENQVHLNKCVIEVIDHRPVDPKISSSLSNRVIEQVGSCCTLVANIILSKNQDILTTEMAKLLHGTIILDTVNFNRDADRFKDLDVEIVDKLENVFSINEKRENIHSDLMKARSDISALTAIQVLQKDMKLVNGIPVPGVPMLFGEFIKRTDGPASLKQLCAKYNTDLVIPMGLANKDDRVFRDIGIFSIIGECQMKNELLHALTNDGNLDLEEIHTEIGGLILFKQNNVKMSRKHLIPIIKNVTDLKT